MISIPENQIIPEYENISECQINPECKFITRKEKFSNEINKLLHNYDNITTRQEKIENTILFFSLINNNLKEIIQMEGIQKWKRFIKNIFNKIYVFESEYNSGNLNDLTNITVINLLLELHKTKIELAEYNSNCLIYYKLIQKILFL